MTAAKTWAGQQGRPGNQGRARMGTRPGARARTTEGERLLQQGLALAGSLLMPLGLMLIGLGWYGAAHTAYSFEQVAYLISGGILGLGVSGVGGFLFFGSWLARIAHEQREQTEVLAVEIGRLADAISALGDHEG